MASEDDILNVDEVPEAETTNAEQGIPIPLTQAKGPSSLTTLSVEYSDDLPGYPTSHTYGHAYVIAANGRSQQEMERIVHEINYAKRLQYRLKKPVYCPFLKCHVHKWTWKCSGILACEFLSPSLKSYYHTSVDDHILDRIQKSMDESGLLESDTSKQNAYRYYQATCLLFNQKKACTEPLDSCKPVCKRSPQTDVHGEHDPYIGCVNESYDSTKHYRGAVQGQTVLNMQFLEGLYNKGTLPPTEECGVFEPLSSRRKHCSRAHPQRSGRLQHTHCDVIFNGLVPVDINQCPWVMFISHGVHKHPPPPPRGQARTASPQSRFYRAEKCEPSSTASNLELKRRELELQKMELDIKKQEEEIRQQQLEIEKQELDLMEMEWRVKMQESQRAG